MGKPDFSTVKVPMKIWQQIPGTNAAQWPLDLDKFVLEICNMGQLSLYEERRELLNEFFDSATKRISIEKDIKLKGKMVSALLAFVIRNGSAVFTLKIMRILHDYQKELDNAPKDVPSELVAQSDNENPIAKEDEQKQND